VFENILRKIASEFSSKNALDYLLNIYRTDHWSSYHKFHQTSDYCYRRLNEFGLENVEVVKHPADGITKYGDWTMPLAWDVRGAELRIVEPVEENRILANYNEEPCRLAVWSSPTPPGGITADVVHLGKGASLEDYRGIDVNGKIVFTSQHPRLVKKSAVKNGAVGIISDFLPAIPGVREKGELPDAVSWINAWSDDAERGFTEEDSKCFAFCISPRQGDYLRRLLRRKKVKVRAVVDTKIYQGTIDTVTGVIRGKTDEEEIWGFSHLYETGAVDNASGSAVILEIARSLKYLINSGKMPPPSRNIRFILTLEDYGVLAYAATRADKCRNVLAAVRMDSAGANQSMNRTSLSMVCNPPYQSFHSDLVMEEALRQYLELKNGGFKWHCAEDNLYGSGNLLTDPVFNIPTTTLRQYPGKFWHTSLDTPNKIDNIAMESTGVPAAVFLYFMANTGYRGTCWLAKLITGNFMRRLSETVKLRYRLRFKGRQDTPVSKWQAQACLSQERTEQTFSELCRVVPAEKKRQFALYLKKEKGRLKVAKAKKLKPPLKEDLKLSALEKKAGRIFSKRLILYPPSFDNLPPAGLKTIKDLNGEHAKLLLRWVDGKRSLWVIYCRMQAVLDDVLDFDKFLTLFKFLKRYRYIKVIAKKSGKDGLSCLNYKPF
jgi:hypothetical protein